MPNKKARATNKKKNKGAAAQQLQRPGGSSVAASPQTLLPAGSPGSNSNRNVATWGGDLSSFGSNADDDGDNDNEVTRSSNSLPAITNFNTIYRSYKEATERFKESLKRKVPASIFYGSSTSSNHGSDNSNSSYSNNSNGNDSDSSSSISYSVHSLMDAVDYLASTDVVIESEMMSDLKLAILARKRVAEYYDSAGLVEGLGGSDEGHEHFIAVLTYCYGKLRSKTAAVTTKTKSSNNRKQGQPKDDSDDPITNRFGSLSVELDEEEDDDDDEDEIDNIPTVRPTVPKRLSLDQLLHGSDRINAILFLMSLNECMELISDQYAKLKKSYRRGKENGDPPLSIIEQLMETAVASNLTIQLVASLEQQLIADHPHMNTIYRLLVVVVFPIHVEDLTKIVTQHHHDAAAESSSSTTTKKTTKREEFKETHAVEFLGDIVECAFRSLSSDPHMKSRQLAEAFAARWKIPKTDLTSMISLIIMSSRLECPLTFELEQNQMFFQALGDKLQMHSWLANYKFIGCDRSITSTIRLLQNFRPDTQGYGQPWDDKDTLASSIQWDMDGFLMQDAMPFILYLSTDGLLQKKLSYDQELLSFFSEIKAFKKKPSKSVPWSLAFAVHAMLTSVMEVQGDMDVHNMGREAKACFQRYTGQVKDVIANFTMEDGMRSEWQEMEFGALTTLSQLDWMFQPHPYNPSLSAADIARMDIKTTRAAWNPMCAGQFLLYATYFGNLVGGSGLIDSCAQLRMVLHLFNAFKCHGALVPGELEFLDWLHEKFQMSKTVWQGAIPDIGQFVYRWIRAAGSNAEEARLWSEQYRRDIQDIEPGVAAPPIFKNLRGGKKSSGKKENMRPQEFSKSFRRICLRDFSDVKDIHHSAEERKKKKHTEVYQHSVRVLDTQDTMKDDEELLASNFICLGKVMDQFILQLFSVLQLDSAVLGESSQMARQKGRGANRTSAKMDRIERKAMGQILSERILAPLDFDSEPLEITVVSGAVGFMKEYFSGQNLSDYMIFTPKDRKKAPVQSSA